jgi:PAS domain S-box-containing protein
MDIGMNSQARFRDAFDQSAVGMAYADADGRYVQVNDRMCELLGFTREELLQRSFMELTHPDDLRRELRMLASLRAGDNAHFSMEKRKRRRDGTYLWVNATISTILDESGNPTSRFVVTQDISQQKEVEAKLQEMNATLEREVLRRTEKLNASLLELEQFAHVVSHDLRAPLRSIAHLSQWIAEDAADMLPPQSAEHLRKLELRVHRMEKLLEDLLAFYRVDRLPTPAVTVDVG